MGIESYGLIGFFTMLQVLFNLLDIGLAPTMSRQTARYLGGATDALSLRRLLRALEGFFIGVAIIAAIILVSSAELISTQWLTVEVLPLSEVRNAVMLMALIVALRWISSLYRGAISGFERLVWLSGWNSTVATLRFVLVIPFFIFVGTNPTDFFAYQLVIAVFELLVLIIYTYWILPAAGRGQWTPWRFKPILGVLKFSLGIAVSSSMWVLVTQTDKLIISKLLPLTEYAYFTLAVLAASGVLLISGPINIALIPRLTKLHAEGNEEDLLKLYRNATQLVAVIAIPTALFLAVFGENVLWAWTGETAIAAKSAVVLAPYALGNGILAMGAFPYYLQFAKGDIKLHLIGSILFVVVLLPVLIWAAWKYGLEGPGYAWLATQLIFFLFWLPVVHKRFGAGLHTLWLRDLSGIFLTSVVGVFLMDTFISWPHGRIQVVFLIALMSLLLLVLAAIGSPWMRQAIWGRMYARFIQ
jgi:O-antigen/teichoic acid export membrane protein